MKRTAYKRTVVAGALLLGLGLPTPAPVQRRDGLLESGRPAEPVRAVDRRVLWDLPVTRNAQVETWIAFLQGRNREQTGLWLQRSGRYAPMIREALRHRGMPEDLVYLAFIESGFSPSAYSHARAAGIWQFIAETGRRYGLEVSSYVDERRDPFKATVAALDYLQKLHGQFGDWYLAAAAYNAGETRVARILREQPDGGQRKGAHGNDAVFWRIAPHLPQETRDYVPLMLAAGHIDKEPAKYGFVNLDYHGPLTFETVEVPGGTRLSTIARAIKVEADDVEELNPHLVRKMTPPGRLTVVRIPAGRALRVAHHRAS